MFAVVCLLFHGLGLLGDGVLGITSWGNSTEYAIASQRIGQYNVWGVGAIVCDVGTGPFWWGGVFFGWNFVRTRKHVGQASDLAFGASGVCAYVDGSDNDAINCYAITFCRGSFNDTGVWDFYVVWCFLYPFPNGVQIFKYGVAMSRHFLGQSSIGTSAIIWGVGEDVGVYTIVYARGS